MKISTAIDVTPTWAGLLPALVELAAHDDLKVRGDAWTELRRMAQAADQWNDRVPTALDELHSALDRIRDNELHSADRSILAAIRSLEGTLAEFRKAIEEAQS